MTRRIEYQHGSVEIKRGLRGRTVVITDSRDGQPNRRDGLQATFPKVTSGDERKKMIEDMTRGLGPKIRP